MHRIRTSLAGDSKIKLSTIQFVTLLNYLLHQGSVISPLLFLIYINGITKASSYHTTLFADDINLHMSNSSFNILQTTVNLELYKIDQWLRANKLSLNYNKTNFMLLTSRKHNPASFKLS